MSHLPVLPILVAAFAGFILVFLAGRPLRVQRTVSLIATVAGLVAGVLGLIAVLNGPPLVYALGDWPAPFGIVLVEDRLSAWLVVLTGVTATLALTAAMNGWDERGRLFHPLFQLQLMGIYGAFLTGDIFNLFVFFEVLLIASYGLLMHGRGAARARAGVKYVVVNLAGSAVFLIGVGTLYGVTGTLNLADLAVKIPEVAAADQGLLRASAFLLLVVFGTKAALLPLFFWLPDAYSSAAAPVAALFAIMTKIGVYAILRVYTIAFGAPTTAVGAAVEPWVLGAALLTLLMGTIGVFQASSLRRLFAYLNIASVGTMLIGVGMFTEASIGATVFYMTHSTLVMAGLFLLAEPIGEHRAAKGDTLVTGTRPPGAAIALLYLALAVSVAGLPPSTGFLGKLLVLESAVGHVAIAAVWTVVLATSLLTVVALSRAGSTLFWKSEEQPQAGSVANRELLPITACVALLIGMTLLAGPVDQFANATAADLLDSRAYVDAVLNGAASGGGG